MSNVRNRLFPLVSAHTKTDISEFHDHHELKGDLGFDSADVLELAFALEQEFSIEIGDEVYANIETVGDLIDMIESELMLSRPEKSPNTATL